MMVKVSWLEKVLVSLQQVSLKMVSQLVQTLVQQLS